MPSTVLVRMPPPSLGGCAKSSRLGEFQINLLRLGGMKGMGDAVSDALAAAQDRAFTKWERREEQREMAQREAERQRALEDAKAAAEEARKAQESLIEAGQASLYQTLEKATGVAVFGLLAFIGVKAIAAFASRKPRARRSK